MRNDIRRADRCPHGWVTTRKTDEKGWIQRFGKDCPHCDGKPVGIPFKLEAKDA